MLTVLKMATKTYAKKISDAQVMVSSLRANAAQVGRRGIDEEFTNKLEADQQLAVVLNNEQEKLKADLISKTAELDAKIAEVEKFMAEAKKVVKLEYPKTQWKEFGIEDKR